MSIGKTIGIVAASVALVGAAAYGPVSEAVKANTSNSSNTSAVQESHETLEERQIRALENELAEANTALEEAEAQIRELQEQHTTNTATISELQENIEEYESSIDALYEEIEEYEDSISELQTSIATKQSQINELIASGQADAATISQLQGEISTQTSTITNLQSQISANTNTISQLQSEISAKETSISELQASNANLTSQVEALNSSIADYEDQVLELESQLSALEAEIIELQNNQYVVLWNGEIQDYGYDTDVLYETNTTPQYEEFKTFKISDNWILSGKNYLGENAIFEIRKYGVGENEHLVLAVYDNNAFGGLVEIEMSNYHEYINRGFYISDETLTYSRYVYRQGYVDTDFNSILVRDDGSISLFLNDTHIARIMQPSYRKELDGMHLTSLKDCDVNLSDLTYTNETLRNGNYNSISGEASSFAVSPSASIDFDSFIIDGNSITTYFEGIETDTQPCEYYVRTIEETQYLFLLVDNYYMYSQIDLSNFEREIVSYAITMADGEYVNISGETLSFSIDETQHTFDKFVLDNGVLQLYSLAEQDIFTVDSYEFLNIDDESYFTFSINNNSQTYPLSYFSLQFTLESGIYVVNDGPTDLTQGLYPEAPWLIDSFVYDETDPTAITFYYQGQENGRFEDNFAFFSDEDGNICFGFIYDENSISFEMDLFTLVNPTFAAAGDYTFTDGAKTLEVTVWDDETQDYTIQQYNYDGYRVDENNRIVAYLYEHEIVLGTDTKLNYHPGLNDWCIPFEYIDLGDDNWGPIPLSLMDYTEIGPEGVIEGMEEIEEDVEP